MKSTRIALAIVVATVAFLAVAAPASAAPPALPAGDQLTSVSCDNDPARLYTVDAATGSSAVVGSSGSTLSCGYQGA